MATPPDFTAGQVLEANAHMNKIGRWLITSQTVGTAVSAVTVSNCFSADYDRYEIIVSGGSSTADVGFVMTLGATTTGYYEARQRCTFAGVSSVSGRANQASFALVFVCTAQGMAGRMTLVNPFLADETWYTGDTVFPTTTGFSQFASGYLANTTSYTSFTLTTESGTQTGGYISVYGLRD